MHLQHRGQQTARFVSTVHRDGARQVTFGNVLGSVQCRCDRSGNAVGQQPGEQQGQRSGNEQQRDNHRKRGRVLLSRVGAGLVELLRVHLHQLAEHYVHLVRVGLQVGAEQAGQFGHVIGLTQRLHAAFKLAIVVEQLDVLVVGRLFLWCGNQFDVDRAGIVDLLVAHGQQVGGFLQRVGVAIEHEPVRQYAQANAALGQLIQRLDARHAVGRHDHIGVVDLVHLRQREDAQNQHQQANDGKSKKGAWGDIQIT